MADPKKVKKYWKLTGAFGFASFISFFQINSAFADKHHINGLWWVLGIGCAIAAAYSFYVVTQNAGGGGDQEK